MAEMQTHTYQLKRGTAQRFMEVNPILRQGEPGFEYDTHRLKIGDGFTPWGALPYIGETNTSSVQEIETYMSYIDLPRVGDEMLLYRVIDDKLLYQWNSDKNLYEILGGQGGGSFDPTIITLINGGNANG